MAPNTIQQVLKDARDVIYKLSRKTGIDIEELNEHYNNVCDRLDNTIQWLEGEE